MTEGRPDQERYARWGLFFVAGLLLVIAIFFDPVGPSPESGLLEPGPLGTRLLLGGLGP